MVLATKRTIEKAQKELMKNPPFPMWAGEKVTNYADFGTFGVWLLEKEDKAIKSTFHRAVFHSANSITVSTPRYAVNMSGKASELSLYSWLKNALLTQKKLKGHESEIFEADTTNDDILFFNRIVTEAILTHPVTAFVDVDKAAKFAEEQIKWLETKGKELLDSSRNLTESPDEEKILAEETAKAQAEDIVNDMLDEGLKNAKKTPDGK
jgi:hypothetical protein